MRESENTYELRKTGWWRHTHIWEFLGKETDITKALVDRTPIVTPNVMQGKHMATSMAALAVATRFEMLPIHTYWAPMTGTDEKVVMVPVFVKENNRSVDMKMEWRIPEGMRIYFVSRWAYLPGTQCVTNVMPVFYMVASDSERQRVYCLPLPNLYDEGKICMGDALAESGFDLHSDIFKQHDTASTHFLKSRWNADLLQANKAANSKRMFRFDSKGNCLPPEMDWKTLCHVINHDAHSFVVNLP